MKDLMGIRIKIENTWPGCTFTKGEIIELEQPKEDCDPWDRIFYNDMMQDAVEYPNLLRRIEWWEYREISDLPDHFKYQNGVYKVKRKYEVCVHSEIHPVSGFSIDAGWTYCLPATEQEYNDSIKPKF